MWGFVGNAIIVRNEDVERIQVFIPRGHRHVRLAVRLRCGRVIVFQHATVDGIIRAFLSVSLHPTRRGAELVGGVVEGRKPGFAKYQLIESGKSEDEVVAEGTELLARAVDVSVLCGEPCLEPEVGED